MLAFLMAENPLEHIVRHPMIQQPARPGVSHPGGKITLLDSHIVMMLMLPRRLLIRCSRSWVRRRRRATDEVGALVPTGAGQRHRGDLPVSPRKEVAQPALGHLHGPLHQVHLDGVLLRLHGQPAGPAADHSARILRRHIGGTATGNVWITGHPGPDHPGDGGGQRPAAGRQAVPRPTSIPARSGCRRCWSPGDHRPRARIFALDRPALRQHGRRARAAGGAGELHLPGAAAKGARAALGVAVPVVLGSVAITLLELFVALLQAFIFTFLTTLFIGQSWSSTTTTRRRSAGALTSTIDHDRFHLNRTLGKDLFR